MSKAFQVVRDFEKAVAEFAGSKYAVATDSCTNALFLSCVYNKVDIVTIPSRTYVSVPGSIIHAGGKVRFEDIKWQGLYQLKPYPIYDGAKRFKKGMYVPGSFHCLSFHAKKHLNIGKGGMILTDDAAAVDWFKQARYEGRHEVPYDQDHFEMIGWNMYMTPEEAARGLLLLTVTKDDNPDLTEDYPDLSGYKLFNYDLQTTQVETIHTSDQIVS